MNGDTNYFVKKDGTLWACGKNNYGQFADGTTTNRNVPIRLPVADVEMVSAGTGHVMVLKKDGTVWGCGYNSNGQLCLGVTSNYSEFKQARYVSGIKKVVCGGHYNMFLQYGGTVLGCGNNGYGQLGLGNTTGQTMSQKIPEFDNVKDIVCGYAHTVFLKNDGTVWACGYNHKGQLGQGNTTNLKTPVQIDITDVKQIACGNYHTMFLKYDGTVWACGDNTYGQLNTNDLIAYKTPVKSITTNVRQIACGNSHTMFLKNDGTVWGCGMNTSGQLGIGDTSSPKKAGVPLSILGVNEISCINDTSVFKKYDGTVWACGNNSSGQTGVGVESGSVVRPMQAFITDVDKLTSPSTAAHRYMIRSGGKCMTIENGSLADLGDTALSARLMDEKGFDTLMGVMPVMSTLSMPYEFLSWDPWVKNTALKLDYVPQPQLIVPTGDIRTSAFEKISNVTLYTAGSGGTIKVIVSVDRGATWKTYVSDAWAAIDPTVDAVGAGGIPSDSLAAIPEAKWAEIHGSTMRFAYYLAKTSSGHTLAADTLAITGDIRGAWVRTEYGRDYDYEYPASDTLLINLLADGTYKINYGGGETKRVRDVSETDEGLLIRYTDNTSKTVAAAGAGPGTGGGGVRQVTISGVTAPKTVQIPIAPTADYKEPDVTVLRLAAGGNDAANIVCGFDNADAAGFVENEDVTYNGTLRLRRIRAAGAEDRGSFTAARIGPAQMKAIQKLEVVD